ncbi:alpha/beta hydrolase family protein [Acidicapsa ligni]|uniref:alpha/beta hydrolase family protein n=1 Tax=Acidicapsa ligni TaxID=542300 RepID=UPI0021E010C0|nr:acetylxylan esterase [Acidicapsa ligni]
MAGRIYGMAIAAVCVLIAGIGYGQTTAESLKSLLAQPVQTTDVTAFQLQQYLSHRITPLPAPTNANDWTARQQQLRKHILDDIAFHGWPADWVHSAPIFQQEGSTETRDGYRVSRFRYEIVPGFYAPAVLYVPEKIEGHVPAILNVIGHEPMGNAAEYEQKRSINFAKRGIIALSLGWVGFGEMRIKEDDHDDAAALDLVGSNALGFFYLGMRRGLDYLASLPQVDPTRLGMTGLSGGGWQTIVLSATDPRIAVSAEVAGFGSFAFNIAHARDADEIEENATDLNQGSDYTFLTAMRAPRPTLLIHNAEDDCCFRAALVKPDNYDRIKPYFNLYGKADALAWYESSDPGTHNYQLVNRLHAYSFFAEQFHLPAITEEIPSSTEIRTPEELTSGIPANNLTITGLARKLAANITRPAIPSTGSDRASWSITQRQKLKDVIRFSPVAVENAWRITATKHMAMRTISYRFDLSNGLSATGIWLKANDAGDNSPATIILNDSGYEASSEAVSRHVNHGEQVLSLDLIFNGFTRPQTPDSTDWETLVSSAGDRPLGLEVSQLLGIAHWLRDNGAHNQIQIETDGIRSSVIAEVAAALEPNAFDVITTHHGMKSLRYLLDTPVAFRNAPDLFCLDLYKYFDVDSITTIAAPTKVTNIAEIESQPKDADGATK